jgi:fructose-1,6-bisphosphatase II
MRLVLNKAPFSSFVKIGEGEMDEAPMLFRGEKLGLNSFDELNYIEIGVDPLEGTNLCANGYNGAMTTICFSEKDSIIECPDIYMEKLIVSNGHSSVVSIENTIEENLSNLSKSLKKEISDLKIIMLNRPRHQEKIDKARKLGAKVFLINDGDIGASLNVFLGLAHMYCGSGGAPEGVLSAACAKSFIGGEFFGKLIIKTDEEAEKAKQCGIYDFDKIYKSSDLIKKDCFFLASAVTNNEFTNGVEFIKNKNLIKTETMVLSSKNKSYQIIKSFKNQNYE